MGGSNEKPLSSASASAERSPAKNLTDGRIHEDKGMVHLHEDKLKLKVEVPSYEYHTRLLEWVKSGMAQPLIFIDVARGTSCTLNLVTHAYDFDAVMTWGKVNFVGNLKSLIEHAESR
jgi:hypothetical protein